MFKLLGRSTAGVFLLAASLIARAQEPNKTVAGSPRPAVFSMDADWLVEAREKLKAGLDPRLDMALSKLKEDADVALGMNAFSVTFNDAVPPSGDKHDYQSLGPYWWPDPAKPDGLPYIRRDGETNPESRTGISDEHQLLAFCSSVNTLTLAYWFTGDELYAERGSMLVNAWFLDPATRMNPNLNFGQAIPGITEGRGIGIIETRRLVNTIDNTALLRGSTAWSDEIENGMQQWCRDYLNWLLESKNGTDEADAKNNHGTWYDFQVAGLALRVGDIETAKKTIEAVKTKRIPVQIDPDGSQPLELERTKSLGYSTMNLWGMMSLARIGDLVGVDLWRFETEDGRGIRKALDFLLPYADPAKPWPHKQIVDMNRKRLEPLLRLAAQVYGDAKYREARKLFEPECAFADRIQLVERGE